MLSAGRNVEKAAFRIRGMVSVDPGCRADSENGVYHAQADVAGEEPVGYDEF